MSQEAPSHHTDLIHEAMSTSAEVPIELEMDDDGSPIIPRLPEGWLPLDVELVGPEDPGNPDDPERLVSLAIAKTELLGDMRVDNFARNMAKQVERLEDTAFLDALTGIANGNVLNQIETELDEDPESDYEVWYLDFDGFKKINDLISHQVGDETLKVVAQAIFGSLREGERIIRKGGDEFVIIKDRTVQSDRRVANEEFDGDEQRDESSDRRDNEANEYAGLANRIENSVRGAIGVLDELDTGKSHTHTDLGFGVTAARAVHKPDEKFAETMDRADKALNLKKKLKGTAR